MRRMRYIVVMLCLLCAPMVRGQDTSAPLFMVMDGDLWAWDENTGTMDLLVDEGFIANPVVSPDGTRLAYVMRHTDSRDEVTAAGDVWIMDIATLQGRQITEQSVEGDIFRAWPVWSPDGGRLAWNEGHQLVMYDLAEGAAHLIRDLPGGWGDAGNIAVVPLHWGSDGIFTTDQGFPGGIIPGSGSQTQTLLVYDLRGSVIFQAEINNGDLYASKRAPNIWVEHFGKQYIGLSYGREGGKIWDLIDPVNGDVFTITDMTELYSVTQAANSASVLLDKQNDWWAISADGQTTTPLDVPDPVQRPSITISPNGERIAFVSEGVFVWREGRIERIVEMSNPRQQLEVAWGAVGWRVRQDGRFTAPAHLLESPPKCDYNFSEVFVGVRGRVAPDLTVGHPGLYRLANPFRLAEVALVGGDEFVVLDGPICPANSLSGFIWWQVEHNGMIGWLPDSPDDTLSGHWLELLPCEGFQTNRLSVGGQAQVIPGTAANNLREMPDANSRLLGQIAAGEAFAALEGPRCGGGSAWWRVEYDGQQGWTAEGQGEVYWLEPLP